MKKIFSFLTALLFVGSLMATDATFVPSYSKGTFSGTLNGAPDGATFVMEGDYTNANQMTKDKYQQLTLSGFDGYSVTAVTVHVKTNAGSGSGKGTLKVNGSQVGSLASTGKIGSTYTDKSFTLTPTTVADDGTIVIRLEAEFNSFYCDKYTVTYETPSSVATPTIKPTTTTFTESVDVTIECTTDGASIFYTTDANAALKDFIAYSAFSITDTTTVRAYAVKGTDTSTVASQTFTKYGPLTCAEFAKRADGVSALLGEVTVTYVNGKYTYVKDNTGVILLYDKNSKELGLAAGDVVTGIEGAVSIYNQLHEVVPSVTSSAISKTSGDAPAPEAFSVAPTSADINKYVVLKDVTVAGGSFTSSSTSTTLDLTIGESTIVLRNTFGKDFTFVGGTHYNVTATVATNSGTLQLYFISAEEKTCSKVVTVTKGDEINGTYDLSAEEICGEGEGDDITVSNIVPAAGYEFDEITTSASGTVDNVNKKVTGITANTTITVKFKALPKYTVYFSTGTKNPEVANRTETLGGQGITLPDAVTPDSAGWSFAGWCESSIVTKTDEAPTLMAPGSNYKPASDCTLYAVYKQTVGASEVNGTVTITYNSTNFPDAYGDANTFTEYTLEGYKFKIQQVYKNGEKMQWRAAGNKNGTGTIYNTDKFPSTISSVVLTYDESDTNKNHTLFVGSSENPTSGTEITGSTKDGVETFDCSEVKPDYFVLANGEYAGYTTSIAINYGDAGTTYYHSSPSDIKTAIDNTEAGVKAVKKIVNGQLFIEKNGRVYNAFGQTVK